MTTSTQTALRAADLITPNAWIGHSGATVTGTETARHLTAALKILERDGWTRTAGSVDYSELNAINDTTPIRSMVRAITTTLRNVFANGPQTIDEALYTARQEDQGDADTGWAADQCLRLLLRVQSGADYADVGAWNARQGRTWDDVRDLLLTAADFAEAHGPTA